MRCDARAPTRPPSCPDCPRSRARACAAAINRCDCGPARLRAGRNAPPDLDLSRRRKPLLRVVADDECDAAAIGDDQGTPSGTQLAPYLHLEGLDHGAKRLTPELAVVKSAAGVEGLLVEQSLTPAQRLGVRRFVLAHQRNEGGRDDL